MPITPAAVKGYTAQTLIENSYQLSQELLKKRLPKGVRRQLTEELCCIQTELVARLHLRNTALSLACRVY